MITHNELRIGNFVDGLEEEILEVKGICNGIHGFSGWVIYDTHGSTTLELITGIPLTSEWLEKFGFELFEDDVDTNFRMYTKEYGRKSIRIYFQDANEFDEGTYNIFYEHELCGYHEIADENTVEYVHQLMNLFFALTGKELEIKNVQV